MKFYLGVTDINWFNYLSQNNSEDINFWKPGGNSSFKALNTGEPFLFKLKSPINKIGGIGFFNSYTKLPLHTAWDIFKDGNGVASYDVFYQTITNYRNKKNSFSENPNIGCIVLASPIFFKKEDWISVPSDWKHSIVQGKTYSTENSIGKELWNEVEKVISKYQSLNIYNQGINTVEEIEPKYSTQLTKVRIGQGAFRVNVIDNYNRMCAITGEKTLPVLEAAHIKPYSKSGSHDVSNGLLLRSDFHKLFDAGYLTITKDFKIEVSPRIKAEFSSGNYYHQYHGQALVSLPSQNNNKPNINYIDWHNTNIFK